MRKLILLSALLGVWILTVASSPVVTGAKVRIKAKKYEETVKLLEDSKSQYPGDPELFYYLGRAYAGIASWTEAGQNFQKALEMSPEKGLKEEIDKWRDHYWASFMKDAAQLLEQKRFMDAIPKMRTANELNPSREETHANLGVALIEHGNALLEEQPAQADSAKKMFAEAIASFQRAIELDPENDQFVKNLGQAYIADDQYDKAIEIFEDFLAKNPGDPIVQRRLTTLYMTANKFEDAARIYDEIMSDATAEISAADAFNAGTAYYQVYYQFTKAEDDASKQKAREYLGKAAGAYEMVLKETPEDCEAATQLYYAYINLEQWDKVVATIETMLAKSCPRDYAILQNLGVAFMKTNQQAKAIEVFKEADKLKAQEGGASSDNQAGGDSSQN